MRKKIFTSVSYLAMAILPSALIFVPIQQARAQFVVSDPVTESNTWVQYGQQVLGYIRQAQQVLTALQHLQLAIREADQLITHPSTNILQDLSMIGGVIQQSQGLALNLAQMDATFQQKFAPFSPSPFISYAAQYNNWATTALNALHASSNSAGFQGDLMLGSEQQFMQQMSQLIQQPNGQDQALQIGQSLAMEQIAQLQKLRTQMASDSAAHAAFMTAQLNQDQTSQAAATTAFQQTIITGDGTVW